MNPWPPCQQASMVAIVLLWLAMFDVLFLDHISVSGMQKCDDDWGQGLGLGASYV